MTDTAIEWTHVPGYTGSVWNPVRGCIPISPGCKHCYAKTFAERWIGVAGHPYEQGFDLRLVPGKLDAPLRARSPRAYFVNSMSDLHQPGVPLEFVRQVYGVMHSTARHIFMVLTKRADLMAAAVSGMQGDARCVHIPSVKAGKPRDAIIGAPFRNGPTPNVWLGVSVEDRKYGLPRVDVLRTIPAAVRFLSVEPLLEDLGDIDLTGIHWVIIGGESGAGARTFNVDWARSIVRQCRRQQVPVFLKQLGAAAMDERNYLAGYSLRVDPETAAMVPLTRLRSRKGADESEWPADLRGLKQFPKVVLHAA